MVEGPLPAAAPRRPLLACPRRGRGHLGTPASARITSTHTPRPEQGAGPERSRAGHCMVPVSPREGAEVGGCSVLHPDTQWAHGANCMHLGSQSW